MLPKISLIFTAITFLVFLSGILLANKEMIPPTAGMALYVLGGALGLICALIAVLVIGKTGAYPIGMLGLLGLLPFVSVLAPALQSSSFPLINDISTDLENPPAFTQAQNIPANTGRDMAFPAGNAPIIREGYPNLQAIQTTKTPAQIFQMALSVSRKMSRWEITHSDEATGIIEGVATTRLFHWKDDFVIRVGETPEGGAILDMRSKSRDGKGDLGANAKRIQDFFDKMTENIVASS